MINEVILVGRVKSIGDEKENKNTLLLEVERPFKEVDGRVSDTFICKLWSSIFNKIIMFSKIGDMLAIRGRIVNEKNEYLVIAEKVVVLNKSKDNILKDNKIWYINYGDNMLHIGKYFGYIWHGGGKILFYPHQAKKYIKNKDEFAFKERYDFVKVKVNEIIDDILRVKLDVKGIEKLNKEDTYLFVPNHQGFLDPLCLLKLFEEPTIFVSKKEIKEMPIVGKINYIIDSIFLDRESPRDALNMARLCKKHLSDGTNVVIFAEGTRSKNEDVTINSYKPGAFKCAYGTNAKIVPVVIDKSYIPLSTKLKNTDKVIKIHFMDYINSNEYEDLSTLQLAQKVENIAKNELEKMRNED